jgi:uncharacterized Zn finger protein
MEGRGFTLDRDTLQEAAEWKSYQRGEEYCRGGLVGPITEREGVIEAMALAWADFVDSPNLEEHQKLKSHADRIQAWSALRERAFAHLRAAVVSEKAKTRRRRWSWEDMPDASTIVQILLWEKDIEAAWREAQEGECAEHLWIELAQKRQKAHPEDALPIYQRQIEPALQRRNIGGYQDAVGYLRKVQGLMGRLGRQRDFAAYLQELRAAHRAKRDFMKLLDQTRWT